MRSSTDTHAELAKRDNISIATVRKCKGRDHAQDRSHRPHTLATTQERLVVELRRMLLLPLDDLLAITREFINPELAVGARSLLAPP